ncbi:MAG: hypothetical protein AAFY09_11240 [Pseudomonadota bacterium]
MEALDRVNRFFDHIENLTEEQQTFDVVNLDEAVQLLHSVVHDLKTLKRLQKLIKVLK